MASACNAGNRHQHRREHERTGIPERIVDTPVHLDPEFPEYPYCERYTYGDEHGVKAGPLATLSAGDYVFFYATLTVTGVATWLPPEWGAFLVGHFELSRDPVTPEDGEHETGEVFVNNAHSKRDPGDARVLLLGDPEESRLYDRAVALILPDRKPRTNFDPRWVEYLHEFLSGSISTPEGGTVPNDIVTDLSEDSGRGPWWRRPLRFEGDTAEMLLARAESKSYSRKK